MQYSRVLSQQRQLLGFLENAVVSYTLKDAPLHTAHFTLSVNDPANEYCQAHNLVELYDGGRRVELFRIIEVSEALYTKNGGTITYKCEHVLATLIDEVIPGYREVGGWGGSGHDEFNTQGCLNYALSFQATKNWVLGRCDFDRHFQYSWEDETVLRAVLSIPNRIETEYMFTYDTTVYPWVINLVKLSGDTDCELRYSRNLHEIRKSMDATQLVTRLYARGYGEGVNQLTIRDVNGGKEYLDADTQGIWGIKSKVWTDLRFEVVQSLKERAQIILDELKNPFVSYKVRAADLYQLTGEPFDQFLPGKLVRVIDGEHDLRFTARVTEIAKPDVRGKPGEITVTIANKAKTVAGTISELANRASIQELYAQGATNIYSQSYADNADKDHPATISVYIPQECVRINKAILRWKLAPFRSYSKGATAGGGRAFTSRAGGGSTQTSSSGGGGTETSSSGGGQTKTSSASGATSLSADSRVISLDKVTGSAQDTGGYVMANTGSSLSFSTGSGSGSTGTQGVSYTSYNGHVEGGTHRHSVESHTHSAGNHYHSVPGHTHPMIHYHLFSHSHTLPGHTHNLGDHVHSLTVDAHTHSVTIPAHTHTVTIPEHTHGITLPDHTHALIAGIFDGPTVSGVAIKVDGTAVPASALSGNELNIISYLSKDDGGKIQRSTWHEITVTPVARSGNTDGLARIVADFTIQTFVRSQGGGDY